jgi:hypothetical protein
MRGVDGLNLTRKLAAMRRLHLALLALLTLSAPPRLCASFDVRTVNSTYDALNRVERIYDDQDRGTIYQYDAGGNVVDLWQPNNGFIETVFDALGRKTTITGYAPSSTTSW